jgi:hypothetical protein
MPRNKARHISIKSLRQRTEKPLPLLLLFLFTLPLLLFRFRFQAFVVLFSVELHQLPLLPMLLNVPLLLRLPPGSPAIGVTTFVLAAAHHIKQGINGLYSNSGLPDLKSTLLYALAIQYSRWKFSFLLHGFLPTCQLLGHIFNDFIYFNKPL